MFVTRLQAEVDEQKRMVEFWQGMANTQQDLHFERCQQILDLEGKLQYAKNTINRLTEQNDELKSENEELRKGVVSKHD